MTDIQELLNETLSFAQGIQDKGETASYIPELAKVDPNQFGMCISLSDGQEYSVGFADTPFSIQSISKVFSLAVALGRSGENLWKRVGKEPTGRAFNSVAYLENEKGRPRNPFINAGALVVTDELLSNRTRRQAISEIIRFIRAAANDDNIFVSSAVAQSELDNGGSNFAIAELLAKFGNLNNHPSKTTQTYFEQCAIEMTVRQLAAAGRILVGDKQKPNLISNRNTAGILSLMMTCGHYDGSGNFAFRVGVPAKSGVGGGILAIVPGIASIAVWSPGLDVYGNSLVGTRALEKVSSTMNWSLFQTVRP